MLKIKLLPTDYDDDFQEGFHVVSLAPPVPPKPHGYSVKVYPVEEGCVVETHLYRASLAEEMAGWSEETWNAFRDESNLWGCCVVCGASDAKINTCTKCRILAEGKSGRYCRQLLSRFLNQGKRRVHSKDAKLRKGTFEKRAAEVLKRVEQWLEAHPGLEIDWDEIKVR